MTDYIDCQSGRHWLSIGLILISSKDRSFNVGDWVYLRLQPYMQKTLAYKGKWKLSPRFFMFLA